jgi:hypothetical protein
MIPQLAIGVAFGITIDDGDFMAKVNKPSC